MADLCSREAERATPIIAVSSTFSSSIFSPTHKKVATILISYPQYVCILIKQATL